MADGRWKTGVMKRVKLIFVSALTLMALAFFVMRQTGLPPAVLRLPGVGAALYKTFGLRETSLYSNGAVAQVLVLRGGYEPPIPTDYHGLWNVAGWMPKIVRGVCYDPEGRTICEVRNGYGVLVAYYDNGSPKSFVNCRDGLPVGPTIEWYSNGVIACNSSTDEVGYEHGLVQRFHPNGQRELEQTFHHSVLVGTAVTWYASGKMATRTIYKSSGDICDFFSADGVLTQRVNTAAEFQKKLKASP